MWQLHDRNHNGYISGAILSIISKSLPSKILPRSMKKKTIFKRKDLILKTTVPISSPQNILKLFLDKYIQANSN